MATIWRGGCIIRARFLDRIREAYDDNPGLPSLLVAPYFADAVARRRGQLAPGGRPGRRGRHPDARVLLLAGLLRRPAAERLPAALIQGLRDNFGAHTYRRVDQDGTFHTEWSGDQKEHDA